MTRPSRSCCGQRLRRALSLVEMIASIVLVGVMLVAAVNTVGASKRGQRNLYDRRQGHELAQALMAEILQQPYADESQLESLRSEILVYRRKASYALGPEALESNGARRSFDDVDDYNGWNASPPQDKDGSPMPELSGWRRTATVAFVNRDDAALVQVQDEGAKRITVNVLRNNVPVATLVALRTLGPPPTECCCLPDGSGVDMLPAQCAALGGITHGTGSSTLNSSCEMLSAPLARWRFNENSGTTATDSERGFVATLLDGATWAGGQSCNALSFDGTTAYAEVPRDDRLDLTSQITITAWIYKRTVSGEDNIIIKGNNPTAAANYYFRTSGDELVFGFANGSVKSVTTTSANLATNTWTHVAGSIDGATGTIAIYKNGSLSWSATVAGVLAANNDAIKIGKTDTGEYFDGRIDDLRIYDKVLTAAQITAIMNGQKP
jgi:type II secretory pathway pseudopilin PulG